MAMMTPAEWAANGEGPISLADALVGLEHVREDLEMIDECLTEHRRSTMDHGTIVELHAIDSTVNDAWAKVREAWTYLQALLATGSAV